MAKGWIQKRKDGKIHAPTADRKWAENTTPAGEPEPTAAETRASEPSSSAPPAPAALADDPEYSENLDGTLTFAEARAAKESYLARLRQLEYEEKAGRLVDAELVRRTQYALLRTIRDRILEVPDRLADELAAETEPGAVHELLRGELRGMLTDLAARIRELGEPEADAEAA